MLYELLVKPFFFCLQPERAHNLAASGLSRGVFAPFLSMNRLVHGYRSARLKTDLCGIPLENPVGLAAGFDKNAEMFPNLHHLGFGYVEIGTVTKHAQAGNPKPRIFRLPQDQGLINRLGFNNHGADAIAARVASGDTPIPLGGNIGKSKITPLEEAVDDYAYTFQKLKPYVDYFVVNVSSPNTPNLRKLQAREPLEQLLTHLQSLNVNPTLPLLLKIAPDLNEDQLDEIVDVVTAAKIDGVIATNTTIGREGLTTPAQEVEAIGAGGLSGKPVTALSTQIIAALRRKLPAQIPIVGVGGIFTGADAYDKILHGANCVQIYTGFIYRGQNAVFSINRELDRLLEADGYSSVKEAVGQAL